MDPKIENGQFNEQPVFNWKCIIFTLALASGYWFLPSKNKWILLGLLYFPYIILAWYDYIYMCQRNLGPTYLANYYWWAKPPHSVQIQQYNAWNPKIKRKVLIIDFIILVGITIIVPFFILWDPSCKCTSKDGTAGKAECTCKGIGQN